VGRIEDAGAQSLQSTARQDSLEVSCVEVEVGSSKAPAESTLGSEGPVWETVDVLEEVGQ